MKGAEKGLLLPELAEATVVGRAMGPRRLNQTDYNLGAQTGDIPSATVFGNPKGQCLT